MRSAAARLLVLTLVWLAFRAAGMDPGALVDQGSTWTDVQPGSLLRGISLMFAMWALALGLQPRPRRLAVTRSSLESVGALGVVLFATLPWLGRGDTLAFSWIQDLSTVLMVWILQAQLSVAYEVGMMGPMGTVRRAGFAHGDGLHEAGKGLAYDRGRVQLLLVLAWGCVMMAAAATLLGAGCAAGTSALGVAALVWACLLPALALASYGATLYAVGQRPPDDEAPVRAGRFGPIRWCEFASTPGRRAWFVRASRASEFLDRPVPEPPSDGHVLRVEATPPGDPQGGWAVGANVQAIVAVLGIGPTTLATLMLMAAVATGEGLGGAVSGFAVPVALALPFLPFVALLLGVAWLVPRALGRLLRPTRSLHLTGDILEADGRRFYLAGATAQLRHGPFGAVLDLTGPDGSLRVRGDHGTLVWLAARVNRAEAPDASNPTVATEQERLRSVMAASARATEGGSAR